MTKQKMTDWREELQKIVYLSEVMTEESVLRQIEDLIESTIIPQVKREVVRKIIKDYGFFDNGCGCCADTNLAKELDDTATKLDQLVKGEK